MTVVFAGGEFDCFQPRGLQTSNNTNSAKRDSAQSRGAMRSQTNSFMTSPVFDGLTSGWCHWKQYMEFFGNSNQDEAWIEFIDSTNGHGVVCFP